MFTTMRDGHSFNPQFTRILRQKEVKQFAKSLANKNPDEGAISSAKTEGKCKRSGRPTENDDVLDFEGPAKYWWINN